MAKRKDKLTELVLRRVEELRAQHGTNGRPMEQKRLATRSKQTYARVHKFLSGQMPYPPLDFLEALLQSFGDNLANVLTGEPPPSQAPILREDVRAVAKLLDDADSPALVAQTRGWIELFLKAQSNEPPAESTGPTAVAPLADKPRGVPRKK